MGGLPNVDEDFLRNFFGKYGKVLDVNIMIDQQNKKSRGKTFSLSGFSHLLIHFID